MAKRMLIPSDFLLQITPWYLGPSWCDSDAVEVVLRLNDKVVRKVLTYELTMEKNLLQMIWADTGKEFIKALDEFNAPGSASDEPRCPTEPPSEKQPPETESPTEGSSTP